MATYSGFDDFVSIDGVNVSAYIRDVELSPALETADVTAGSGVSHRERNPGLKDHEITITFVHDPSYFATLTPLIRTGTHTIIWGPEGNATGKPCHEQSFIITENGTAGNYEQSDARVFSVSGEAAAAPVRDMFNGGVF